MTGGKGLPDERGACLSACFRGDLGPALRTKMSSVELVCSDFQRDDLYVLPEPSPDGTHCRGPGVRAISCGTMLFLASQE